MDFKEIILDRLTFEAKRTALKNILDRDSNSKGFIKTNTKKPPHNELIEEIRKLNVERIRFAHYCVTKPLVENKYVIGLMEFRDSTKAHYYTEEDILHIVLRIHAVIETLYDDPKNIKG